MPPVMRPSPSVWCGEECALTLFLPVWRRIEAHPLDVLSRPEPASHRDRGFGVVVDEEESAPELQRCGARGATAREEIQHEVSLVGVHCDDAFQYCNWLLGGMACLLVAVGADNGVPPDVRGGLASGGLFLSHDTRSHVRDAIYFFIVEGIGLGVARIPEDVVVLRRPLPL